MNALPPGRVHVTADSEYVVKGMTKWMEDWQLKGWRTSGKKPVKNQELWKALLAAVERHESVEWEWVRGHDGHPENARVDELAQLAAADLPSGERVAG